jgi:hypothetical protein
MVSRLCRYVVFRLFKIVALTDYLRTPAKTYLYYVYYPRDTNGLKVLVRHIWFMLDFGFLRKCYRLDPSGNFLWVCWIILSFLIALQGPRHITRLP